MACTRVPVKRETTNGRQPHRNKRKKSTPPPTSTPIYDTTAQMSCSPYIGPLDQFSTPRSPVLFYYHPSFQYVVVTAEDSLPP